MDLRLKVVVATVGRQTADSLVNVKQQAFVVADTKFKLARSELWIWRGTAAAAMVLLFFK